MTKTIKNLLVLGGTQMLGRDLIESTIPEKTYNIFLANRGLTNRHLFPDLIRIKIDRQDDSLCTELKNYIYDTVVDFSCYNIDQFNNTKKFIQCQKYILVSTMSVFEKNLETKADSYRNYCIEKRKLETYIENNPPSYPVIFVRPCAVYGDNDYTNRFESRSGRWYWKNTKVIADQHSGAIGVSSVTAIIKKLIANDNFLEISHVNIVQ